MSDQADDPKAPATLAETRAFADVLSDRIDGLSQSLRGVIAAYHADTAAQLEVAKSNRESAAATKEALRRRTRLEWIVYAALVVVIAGLVGVGIGTYSVYDVGRKIDSCTDPQGKCAQQQQKQTNPIVQRIINGQGIAAWCGAHTPTKEAAAACVDASTP